MVTQNLLVSHPLTLKWCSCCLWTLHEGRRPYILTLDSQSCTFWLIRNKPILWNILLIVHLLSKDNKSPLYWISCLSRPCRKAKWLPTIQWWFYQPRNKLLKTFLLFFFTFVCKWRFVNNITKDAKWEVLKIHVSSSRCSLWL